MNIDDIFGRRKLTKKERKEQRQRELERMQQKAELARFSGIDRKAKLRMVKRVEKNPAFQKDLGRMKEVLTKPLIQRDYNIFKPQPGFLKSDTNVELKGFDKTFKKKGKFLFL